MNRTAGTIALVGLGSVFGCAAGDIDSQTAARDTEAVCSNPDVTSALVATLAETIGSELHRWELTTDFYKYTGYGNQLMLGLTATGLAQCGGSCPLTASLLGLQDPRMDLKVVLGSQRLGSSAFASRLTTGFDNQASCNASAQCPYESHVLAAPQVTPGGDCNMLLASYGVTAPSGGNLNNPAALDNALFWTGNNGPNPYIAFQSTSTSVTIDPTGGINPLSPWYGGAICQKYSVANLNGTPCTCAANGIYANGQLLNNFPQVPMTYFCTQVADVCQKFSATNIYGTSCTCAAQNIYTGGQLFNDVPQVPMTYFCRQTVDQCQWLSSTSVNGSACACHANGISQGQFQNNQPLTPALYFCTGN